MNTRSLTLLAAAALAACKPQVVDLPICPEFVGSDRADEADTRSLPPDVWFQLLVPRISRPQLLTPDEPHDCSGSAIALTWNGPDVAALDPRSRAEPLTRRPLTDADLSFGEGPDGSILVWARLEFFSDGTAKGPVALARWAPRGLEIRGIGTLWAPYRRPRLRLEPLGDDAQVLVADAELCAEPAGESSPRRCHREIYLLPLIGQRFVHVGLLEDGVPAGPARIVSFEQREAPRRDGWIRRSQVRRSLKFKDGRITIAERIQVHDCDPRADNVCAPHEAVSDVRPLEWGGKDFSTRPSAWEKAAVR